MVKDRAKPQADAPRTKMRIRVKINRTREELFQKVSRYRADPRVLEAIRKLPERLAKDYEYAYTDLLLHMNIVLASLEDCTLPENFLDHHIFDIFRRSDTLTAGAARALELFDYKDDAAYLRKHVDELYEDFKKEFEAAFRRCVKPR